MLVGVAVTAVALAIADGGDGDDADETRGQVERAPRAQPEPRPEPRPERPPDSKGYPEGTKEEFVSTCGEETPLDEDACGCVYNRLHDDYSYEEFRRLIRRIDAERRRVPPEILEHVLPCRLP